jgi:hypothetical protein
MASRSISTSGRIIKYLHTFDDNKTHNQHVRLLSYERIWLVRASKVYPGVGADIVMESISPTMPVLESDGMILRLSETLEAPKRRWYIGPFPA